MEKNFYNDEFENYLKESTENFRMYPSRKVWHSIYNDLHPSRKWPSLAVCLVLITAILFVGVSNNNSLNSASRQAMEGSIIAAANASMNADLLRIPQQPLIAKADTRINQFTSIISGNTTHTVVDNSSVTSAPVSNAYLNEETPAFPSIKQTASFAAENLKINITAPVMAFIAEKNETSGLQLNTEADEQIISDQKTGSTTKSNTVNPKNKVLTAVKNSVLQNDLAWIDDHAFYNKPFIKIRKNKLAMQYYVTPSVGFRKLTQINDIDLTSSSLIATRTIPQEADDKVTQKAALNLEAGAMVLYSLSKRLRIKTGLQVNYTNYIITAYDLEHPVQTSILLNDPQTGYPEIQFRSTTYGNNAGTEVARKLNNNTIQFSVPVGADFKIAGNKKLNWYVGATIQPTHISSGHAYVLSTDAKHYIEESSLLRKWNMNAGVETFVTYKTASGIDINLGPQLRYQLFSTYNKQYSYSEKLYNMGIKLGMTKSF
jgi:hypothetical protein